MKKQLILGMVCVISTCIPFMAIGQNDDNEIVEAPIETPNENFIENAVNPKKIYITGSADASMFQVAATNISGNALSRLRYTLFFNGGFLANRNIGSNLAVYTGLSVKNIGLILKNEINNSTLTQKYRVYTIGVPLGVKIGNVNSNYLILGGGVDFPFHYKEKFWNKRSNKNRRNEWFSNTPNQIMPFVNVGYRFKSSLTAKFVYYPTNFWSNNTYPAAEANILMLTLGYDINAGLKGRTLKINKK